MPKVEGCPSGESPGTPRKRLPSAEDARCSSRPPPEGAGSVSISESEEKGGFCQQCQKKVAELKKQALALADQNSLKVGEIILFASLFQSPTLFASINAFKFETMRSPACLAILQHFLSKTSQNRFRKSTGDQVRVSEHRVKGNWYQLWQQPLSL